MFLITLFREKSVNKGYVHIYALLMTSEYVSVLHCNANSLSQQKLIGKALKSAIGWFQKIDPRNTEVFNERWILL